MVKGMRESTLKVKAAACLYRRQSWHTLSRNGCGCGLQGMPPYQQGAATASLPVTVRVSFVHLTACKKCNITNAGILHL